SQDAHPRALGPSGVLKKPSHGIGRGHRLPRLADSPGAPLSGAEALVRAPALWGDRPSASHPEARGAGAAIRRMGQAVGRLRARRAGAAQPDLLSPPGGRRREPAAHGGPQPRRRPLLDPHAVERPLHAPALRGADADRGAARGAGLAENPGDGAEIGARRMKNHVLLETPRLALRPLRRGDLDFVAAMLASLEVMRFYPRTYSREEARAWIERQLERYRRDGHGLCLVSERATG